MIELLSGVLFSLYRGSRENFDEGFQGWAIGQLADLLGFDAAFWGSGVAGMGAAVLHTSFRYRLSHESQLAWERHKHMDDLVHRIYAAQGTVLAINHDELHRSVMYPVWMQPYGINHMLCTYRHNSVTGIFDAISFYRSDLEKPFREEERRLAEALVPHMVETFALNRLQNLCPRLGTGSRTTSRFALADREGILHTVAPGFSELLQGEWPEWAGPRLPQELRATVHSEALETYQGRAIVVDITESGEQDLLLLQARVPSKIDQLSEREKEIARLFAEGMSHKEIARGLDISPATVRVHLNNTYQKLGIGSKAELARQFA